MNEMHGTPSTWFSGRSAPEDQRRRNPSTLFAVIFFMVSPLGAATAFVGYLLFSLARLSWKVIAGATGVYALVWILLGGAHGAFLSRYLSPLRDLATAFHHKSLGDFVAQQWPYWVGAQLPLSLLLGGIVASTVTWWKWMRRPAWEENDRVPGPIDLLRRQRTVAAIASDTKGPDDGITLGRTRYGLRVIQTDAEGSAHTVVAGGSGAGKTTTMLIGMRDLIRRGHGLIVVDLKGGPDVPEQLAEWAARYGRRFLHWQILDPRADYTGPADAPAFYDPIGRGDPSRRKDLLIGSQKWDVEYYKTVIANYLQIAFRVADLVPAKPGTDSLADLAALLDPKNLAARASALAHSTPLSEDGRRIVEEQGGQAPWYDLIDYVLDPQVADLLSSAASTVRGMEESERSGIRNMSARVQTLIRSTAGAWLKKDPAGHRDIDLRRAADEGWVVVFSVDSSNYEETSAQIAGLIIQDLKTLSSELRQRPSTKPFHIYVDEFAAVGSDNILGLLNKARDARMPVTLSTQALADLKRKDPAFVDQVIGIVGCFIIHRANAEPDAEVFAGLTGKHNVFRKQYGVEMTSGLPGTVGTGAATGHGFIREEQEYRVLPSVFQDLEAGEMVYIAKSPKTRVEPLVFVVRESASATVARALQASAQPGVLPSAVGEYGNRESLSLNEAALHDDALEHDTGHPGMAHPGIGANRALAAVPPVPHVPATDLTTSVVWTGPSGVGHRPGSPSTREDRPATPSTSTASNAPVDEPPAEAARHASATPIIPLDALRSRGAVTAPTTGGNLARDAQRRAERAHLLEEMQARVLGRAPAGLDAPEPSALTPTTTHDPTQPLAGVKTDTNLRESTKAADVPTTSMGASGPLPAALIYDESEWRDDR